MHTLGLHLDALSITPDRRLALAYAPRASRDLFLGLFALDARLGTIVQAAREPMLAQLKLAWWREQLEKPPARRAAGEPLLALLEPWGDAGRVLSSLTEGWEHLLAEDRGELEIFRGFVQARGQAVAGLAEVLGDARDDARLAAEWWALGDLFAAAANPAAIAAIELVAQDNPQTRLALGRNMRPLFVLQGLARRSLQRGNTAHGAGGLLLAMRLGMLGI